MGEDLQGKWLDKRTGKTEICLDTIVNQKGQNVICFYVAIGKTKKM